MSRNAKRLLSYIMCLAMLLVAALPAMPAYAEAQATDSAAPAEGGEAAAEADQAPAEETPQAPGADAEATDGADAEPAPGGEGENDAADAADSPEGADSADDPDATDTTEGADGAEADPAGDAGEAPPADAAPLSDEAAESAAPLAPLAEPEPIIKAAQPWQDHNADTADRLQSLVDALTLDEKIAIAGGSLSAVNRLGVNGGRGGGGEGLHGVAWDGQATMFPSSLGLSQSFDKKLLEDIGDAIANESLAGGISSAGRLAPVVDLLRDPRYGRAYETLGEDAYLTGTLGIAMANGMSKRTGEDGYIRFIPILKHFMAYNAEINRLWVASSISPRNIAEYYSKAFKYPVAAGASYSLMNSYPLVAGKPMSVSPLQYELLYKWTPKFPGTDHYEYLTTNDYGSGSSMWVHSQRYFEDTTLGRALGIAEGTKNGQMGWSLRDFGSAGTAQYEALARGMATEKDFEENAKRAIAIALRTGDLDQIGGPQSPYLPNASDDDQYNDTTADIYGTRQSQIQANKGLALQASQEQIVLLKNEGNTLPLNTTSAENTGVTLLGPLADQVLKDFYSGSYKYRITIYDALRNTLGTDKVSFNRAVDTVAIQAPGGKYLQGGTAPAYVSPGSGGPDTQNVVASSGAAPVLGDAADASRLYRLYDYGSENILLQSVANDRYLQVTNRTAAQNPHTLQNNTSAPGEGNLDETAGGQNLSYSTFQKFRLAPTALGITTPYSGVYGIYHLLSGDGINDGVGLAYDVDDEDLNRGSYVKFDNAKGTVVTKIPDVSDELAKDPSYADAWVSVESGAGLGGYPWRTEHNVKSPVDAVDDSEGIVDGLDSDQKFTFSNIQSVEDAASAAISATNDDDAPIILVVGYEPHLNAREGIDLYKTGLSPQQTRLVQYVTGYDDATTTNGGLGKEVILIVKTGNPMTIDKKIHENPNVKAIIEIGHTGQEEGSAIVSALFDGGYTVPAEDGKWFPDREYAAEGQSYQAVFSEYPGYLPSGGSRTIPAYAPAGRLSATWYDGINQMLGASEDHAPASYIFPNYDETKNDNLSNMNGTSNTGILTYDIIKGERTYQYLQGAPLYPFGYGLTYSEFEYSGVTVSSISDGKFTVTGKVKNKGQTYTSDEVVQVYSVFDGVASRIKQPVKRLIAYDRLKAIEPSGVREFSFEIDLVDMLGLWDVETAKYIVENGTYTITVGSSSAVTALSVGGTYDTLTVDDSNGGTDASVRDLTSELTLAENMDDYGSTAGSVDDVEFISVSDAYNSNTAIQFRKAGAWAAYKNVRLNGETSLAIRAGSDRAADVKVYAQTVGGAFNGSEGTLIATFSSLTNTRPSAIATGLGIGPVAPYPGSADGQLTAANYEKPEFETYSATLTGGVLTGNYDIYVVTSDRGVVLEWLQFNAPAAATGITISNLYSQSSIREQNGTLQLDADLAPVTATSAVAWSVANNPASGAALATITSDGLLTATGAGNGTVTVTASTGGAQATLDVLITNQLVENKVAIEDVGERTVEFILLSQQSVLDLSMWIPGWIITINFSVSDSISQYQGALEQTAMFSELLSEHVASAPPTEGDHDGYYLPGDVLTLPASEIIWELRGEDGILPTTLATIDETGLVTAAGTEDGKVTVVATLKNNPDIFATRVITLQNQGAKDGSAIIQAENFDAAPGTSAFTTGAAYNPNAGPANELGLYAEASMTVPGDGQIGDHGEALALYRKVDFGTDANRLYLRTASAADVKAEAWIDGPSLAEGGLFLGLFDIIPDEDNSAMSMSMYETQIFPLNEKISGVHDLYIRYIGPDATETPPPGFPPYVPGGITTALRANWLQLGYVADEHTVYAKVAFDAQGGEPAPAEQSVAAGGKAARPANPAKADFAFTGWRTEPDGGGDEWDFGANAVIGDMTLYASWIPAFESYTATFDTQGGEPAAIEPQTLPEGSLLQRPAPDPAKAGFTFGGWYLAADGTGSQWQFNSDALASDITLYAKWVEIPPTTFTVTFISNGGTEVAPQVVAAGGKATAPANPARAGYAFVAWRAQPDLGGSAWNFGADIVAADMALYAQWAEIPADSGNAGPGSSAGSSASSIAPNAAPEPGEGAAPADAETGTDEETETELEADAPAGDGYGLPSDVKIDVAGGGKAQVAADGTVTIPRGATADIALGGGVSVKAPGGTTIAPDGTVSIPEGATADIALGGGVSVKAPGGTTIGRNGTVIIPEGAAAEIALRQDVTVEAPGSTIITSDGTVRIPVGAGSATARLPDGTSARIPQGNVIFEDEAMPFGFAYRYANPFSDVTNGDWFSDAVQYAVENELFAGTSADTFSPGGAMTRAMIVTVLYRAEGQPAVAGPGPFEDVADGQWYTSAIAWAAANGVVKGFSDTAFGGDEPVTREQIAAILQRYAEYKGEDMSAGADVGEFADAASISGYALDAVRWAVGAGLIQGRGANDIAPQGDATRAEVAAIIQRYMER